MPNAKYIIIQFWILEYLGGIETPFPQSLNHAQFLILEYLGGIETHKLPTYQVYSILRF